MPDINTSLSSFNLRTNRPLIIGSSGGNGHNIAAENIIQELLEKNMISLPYHYWQKPQQQFFSFETLVNISLKSSNFFPLKWCLQKYFNVIIPSYQQIKAEKELLFTKGFQTPKRFYMDFILDILPNGYIFAAIFNYMQKIGHPNTLKNIVQNQSFLDWFYKKNIEDKIYKILLQALDDKKPFDCIISTQPMGIEAICNAIQRYNEKLEYFNRIQDFLVPKIEIHEFVTDIPHLSACHFLKPLENLNPINKSLLNLHLLDIEASNYFSEDLHAKHIFRYKPQENPMIRMDFKKTNNIPGYGIHILHLKEQIITLTPKQRLGLVMLSSGNGDICIDYLNELLKMRIEHIVIIGHPNETLRKYIQKLNNPNIYLPGQLDSKLLSQLLNHAHLMIIKGGGLSLMEMSSITLKEDTIIFIHQPFDEISQSHDSGLEWENGNTHWFINYCQKNYKTAFISHPTKIRQQYLQHNNCFQ